MKKIEVEFCIINDHNEFEFNRMNCAIREEVTIYDIKNAITSYVEGVLFDIKVHETPLPNDAPVTLTIYGDGSYNVEPKIAAEPKDEVIEIDLDFENKYLVQFSGDTFGTMYVIVRSTKEELDVDELAYALKYHIQTKYGYFNYGVLQFEFEEYYGDFEEELAV